MEVYAAFRSVPDYHAPSPTLLSLHKTLEGAIKALYPNVVSKWTKVSGEVTWNGPDGFGLVRKMEVLP